MRPPFPHGPARMKQRNRLDRPGGRLFAPQTGLLILTDKSSPYGGDETGRAHAVRPYGL